METYYEREQEFRGNVCGVEINSQETFYVLAELIEETDLGRLLRGADENDGKLFIKELVSAPKFFRKEMNFTFHMAFDHIGVGLEPKEALEKRIEAIKTLSKLGIDTILTHGSHESNDIFENIETLKAYIECGIKNHVDIMPGGGVNFENLDKLTKKLPNMVAAHGTKIVEI